MSTFTELHLDERILGTGLSHTNSRPSRNIPALMDGRDVMGIAQTGKTAAFALPILHHLASEKPSNGRPIRALMLTRPESWLRKSVSACAPMAVIYPCIPPSFSVAWGSRPKSSAFDVVLICWSQRPAVARPV